MLQIDLARWLYLILYLAAPVGMIVYLIRAFGLSEKEDALAAARRHIEQASYWMGIAVTAQTSSATTKSFASLEHTIRHNLNRAHECLAAAGTDAEASELRQLRSSLNQIEEKFNHTASLVRNPQASLANHDHL